MERRTWCPSREKCSLMWLGQQPQLKFCGWAFLILTRSLLCNKLRNRRNAVIAVEQKLHNVNANFLVCVPGSSYKINRGRCALKTPKPNCCVVQFYAEQQLSIVHGGRTPKPVFLDEWEDLKSGSKDFFGCCSSHPFNTRRAERWKQSAGFQLRITLILIPVSSNSAKCLNASLLTYVQPLTSVWDKV